jgi:hypothetical protein
MKKSATFLATAIAPLVAGMCIATSSNAQSTMSDEAYCHKLAELFTTPGGVIARGGTPIELDASVAIAQCQEGNPGPAIPVLEQMLRDQRVPVPPRT